MPFSEVEIQAINKLRENMIRNDKYRNEVVKNCPVCGHNVQDRDLCLFQELIDKLYEVYCWCGANKTHEFEMRQIKHLLGKNEYARFGDLVRFGGIVYKPDQDGHSRKGLFGINMARAKEFFAGKRKIPVVLTLNQITNKVIASQYVDINHFPRLSAYLNEHGLYDPEKLF